MDKCLLLRVNRSRWRLFLENKIQIPAAYDHENIWRSMSYLQNICLVAKAGNGP